MKKYIIPFMLAILAIFKPYNANAMFPTFDCFAISESVISNMNLVKQFNKVKESSKTISNISNSIGSAAKSFSQFALEKKAKAEELLNKANEQKAYLQGLQAEYKAREEEIMSKKAEVESAVQNAKDYQAKIGNEVSSKYDLYNSYKDQANSYKDQAQGYIDQANSYKDQAQGYIDQAKDKLGAGSSDEEYYDDEAELYKNKYDVSDYSSNKKEPTIADKPKVVTAKPSMPSGNLPVNDVINTGGVDDSQYANVTGSPELVEGAVSNQDLRRVANDSEEDVDVFYLDGAKVPSDLAVVNDDKAISKKPGLAIKDANNSAEEEEKVVEEPKENTLYKRLNEDEAKSTIRRKPFGKTSFYYKSSELMVSADATPAAGANPDAGASTPETYDGTVNGRFVLPKEMAYSCKLSPSTFSDATKIEGCLKGLIRDMNLPNASAAHDGQKKFGLISKERNMGNWAAGVKLSNEAAQYEEKVLDPLMKDVVAQAKNTRDDTSGGALIAAEAVKRTNVGIYVGSLNLMATAEKNIGANHERYSMYVKEEDKVKAKAEADAKAKSEAEAKAKAEADAKAKGEAEKSGSDKKEG